MGGISWNKIVGESSSDHQGRKKHVDFYQHAFFRGDLVSEIIGCCSRTFRSTCHAPWIDQCRASSLGGRSTARRKIESCGLHFQFGFGCRLSTGRNDHSGRKSERAGAVSPTCRKKWPPTGSGE